MGRTLRLDGAQSDEQRWREGDVQLEQRLNRSACRRGQIHLRRELLEVEFAADLLDRGDE